MRRKFVYMAHPLRGKTHAETAINRYCASALVAKLTAEAERVETPIVPIAPWLHLAEFWSEEEGRSMGLTIDKAAIDRCDELWLLGPKQPLSPGMQIEVTHAQSIGIPVIDKRGGE